MKKKVVYFYLGLFVLVLLLAYFQFGSNVTGNVVSELKIENDGGDFGVLIDEINVLSDDVRVDYAIQNFKDEGYFIDLGYVLSNNGEKIEGKDRIYLESNSLKKFVLKIDFSDMKGESDLKLLFKSEGYSVNKHSSVMLSKGITGYTGLEQSNEKDNGKLTIYGVVFLVIMGLIFAFDIFYKRIKRDHKKSEISDFGKIRRKTIGLDFK